MMTEKNMLLALFQEIDPAAQAVDKLRAMGIENEHVNVISGTPITEAMLGRPHQWTNVPRLAMGGAVGGLIVGIFFAFGTPALYPVYVGGQPLYPVPPSIVVLFELTMLGIMLSTFLGVFLDSRFPSYSPKVYVPEISDGYIALLIDCAPEQEEEVKKAMTEVGAESVKTAEVQPL
jgi:di/tricarboxylate transporter